MGLRISNMIVGMFLISILFYLAGLVANAETDIKNWAETYRWVSSSVWLGICGIYCLMVWLNTEGDDDLEQSDDESVKDISEPNRYAPTQPN